MRMRMVVGPGFAAVVARKAKYVAKKSTKVAGNTPLVVAKLTERGHPQRSKQDWKIMNDMKLG